MIKKIEYKMQPNPKVKVKKGGGSTLDGLVELSNMLVDKVNELVDVVNEIEQREVKK